MDRPTRLNALYNSRLTSVRIQKFSNYVIDSKISSQAGALRVVWASRTVVWVAPFGAETLNELTKGSTMFKSVFPTGPWFNPAGIALLSTRMSLLRGQRDLVSRSRKTAHCTCLCVRPLMDGATGRRYPIRNSNSEITWDKGLLP